MKAISWIYLGAGTTALLGGLYLPDWAWTFPYLALPASGSSTSVDTAGYTVLTGGSAPDSPTGVPGAVPVGLIALGALSFLVGAAGLLRRRTTAIPVTA